MIKKSHMHNMQYMHSRTFT